MGYKEQATCNESGEISKHLGSSPAGVAKINYSFHEKHFSSFFKGYH